MKKLAFAVHVVPILKKPRSLVFNLFASLACIALHIGYLFGL